MTGHRGLVGRSVVSALEQEGYGVVGLDLIDGDDVLDAPLVSERIAGCDAVVHLAAVESDDVEQVVPSSVAVANPDRVEVVNVGGTEVVLAAAAAHEIGPVVYVSSVDVLGCFMGQGSPAYYPIDDEHPVSPQGLYAESKLRAEGLCEQFTAETGSPTICLRPPGVFDADTYAFITQARADDPEFEWSPFWEYGAFIDVRDLASAVCASLTADVVGHHRVLVCADDISSSRDDSWTLARAITPDVPIRDTQRYEANPYASLLDTTNARHLLGWKPVHTWRRQRRRRHI